MQSNAKWLIKLLGQKIKSTLAFNQSGDVAQNIFNFKLFKALEPRSLYVHQSSHKYTKQTNKHTKEQHTKQKRIFKRTY
jgi:hypothetical protein